MIIIDEACDDLSVFGFRKKKISKDVSLHCLSVISNGKSRELGVDIGEYRIINCNNLYFSTTEQKQEISRLISLQIKQFISKIKLKKSDVVLVCGIGNRDVPSDNFGIKVCENVLSSRALSSDIVKNNVCAICPTVELQSGINTTEIVEATSKIVNAKLVILVDSLMTENINRLGCSFQISTSGLTPAGAFGKSKTINKKLLGVDCITIGVPFMFNLKDVNSTIKDNIIVSAKDIVKQVKVCSTIIANSINDMFNNSLSESEIHELLNEI